MQLVVALLLFPAAVLGQTSYHIGVEDGLPTNNIATIIRGRDGYMWFGSYEGLLQHQGNTIRGFNRVGRDARSLSSSDVNAVCEDKAGNIWIGTTGGLDRLDPQSGLIRQYRLRAGPRLSQNIGWIYSVFEDREHYIWASSDAALFRLDPRSGSYETFLAGQGSRNVPASATGYHQGFGNDDYFLIATGDGPALYRYRSHTFEHRFNSKDPLFQIRSNTGGSAGSDLCMDDSGRIYFVAGGSTLVRYTLRSRHTDTMGFAPPPGAWNCCYALACDHRGNIWIGFRNGGLLVYTPADHRFTPIRSEMQNRLIRTNYIYSLAEDYQHRMWVTTNEGVDVIDYYQHGLQLYHLSDAADYNKLVHASGIMSLDSSGWLLLPFYNSQLFAFQPATTRKVMYEMRGHQVNGKPYAAALPDGSAREATTPGKGASILPDIPEFRSLRPGPKRGIVWRYDANGIIYEKHYDDSLLRVERDGSRTMLPTAGFLSQACIANDRRAIYFLGRDLNLVRQDFESGRLDSFDVQGALAKAGIAYPFPRALADDGRGNIWITTQSGMLRYNLKTQQVMLRTTSNGLSNNFCFAVLVDNHGVAWVSSLGGVDWFDESTGSFRNVIRYNDATYLDAFGSSLKTADGALFFNTGNRLLRIQPDEYQKSAPVPLKLMLHEIQVNGVRRPGAADPKLQELRPDENRLLFRYGLLDFGMPRSSLRLQYRLDGIEREWTANERGEVSYSGLPPGHYTFRLRALAQHNDEVILTKTVAFYIRPAFWQTWWALTLALLLIAAIATILVRHRIAAIRRKADLRLHITELESRALRAQMNPHFIFNSLNAIQELVIREDTAAAYAYLAKFSRLLRMVLQHAEHSSILLADELDMYRLYLDLESLRFNHTFSYAIRVEDPLDEEAIRIPPLLLQPYLENAIWHGLLHRSGAKLLDLHFREEADCMVCTITDNGIGREAAIRLKAGSLRQHDDRSRGLSLTEQRVRVLNTGTDCRAGVVIRDLHDECLLPSGTQVIVTLPLVEQPALRTPDDKAQP